MTFKVIDKSTGKEPTYRVIHNIAKRGGLMTMDIDQFFLGEDGSLVLADDCGNFTYCDRDRFKVVAESEEQDRETIETAIRKGTPLSKYHTDSIVPYLLHTGLGCPLNECVNAYEKAIEYLRSKANMKG